MFTSETRYGIEIEFTHDRGDIRDEIVSALRQAGIDAENQNYNHRTASCWKLVTDSSCGLELVSPILEGYEGLDQIKTVLEVLRRLGAKVNKNCGTHVHLDARWLDFEQIKEFAQKFINNEDIFDAIQPESRRGNKNRYCQGHRRRNVSRTRSIEKLILAVGVNRYTKLNLHSFHRYGSIEIRHHAGTLNYNKISNWIQLLAGMLYGGLGSLSGDVRSRFNALFSAPRSIHVDSSFKMKNIKELFYDQSGLSSTKEIQRWAKERGHSLNLRKKEDWVRLFDLYFVGQTVPVEQNNIKEFFRNRANSFGVIAV